MGIIFGLGAALAFGLADFCASFAAHKIGNFRTLLYMQLIGGIGLSLWLVLVEKPRPVNWLLILLALLLGIGNTTAGLSLYRAFEVGMLSVVSPIAASYGAISLLLGLASGQTPSFGQLFGLVITIVGVALSSTRLSRTSPKNFNKANISKSRGIPMALIAALGFGIVFWGLGFVSPDLGGILPIWEFRLVGVILLLSLARPFHQSINPPTGKTLWLVGIVGLLDTIAFLCLNFGTQHADSSLVAVLSSLFSAITVLLARIFLNEKLVFNQWAGIFFILLGLGLVSAE